MILQGFKYKLTKRNREDLKMILLEGTAGSGKSLLASKLAEYYTGNGAFPAILNLDPGAEDLPYSCDVDVRDMVDVVSVMRNYGLGPNGAVVMANDIVASRIGQLQEEINAVNPDYLIVDTPGQIELFAYRVSGPLLARELAAEQRVGIFLYDGVLVNGPANFVSISLLAASIRLRLGIPAVNVLTKSDLLEDKLGEILEWSSDARALEDAVSQTCDGEIYSLTTDVLRGLDAGGFYQGLVPVSNITGDGMDMLEASLSRIINRGEEVED